MRPALDSHNSHKFIAIQYPTQHAQKRTTYFWTLLCRDLHLYQPLTAFVALGWVFEHQRRPLQLPALPSSAQTALHSKPSPSSPPPPFSLWPVPPASAFSSGWLHHVSFFSFHRLLLDGFSPLQLQAFWSPASVVHELKRLDAPERRKKIHLCEVYWSKMVLSKAHVLVWSFASLVCP